jgi:hypothetical protein
MAVVSVQELFDSREGGADKDGRATYSRTWEVITDDPLDGPKTASAAAGIPARGAPYETDTEDDPFALAQDARVRQSSESPLIWYVTVNYDSRFDWPTGVQPSDAVASSGSGGTVTPPDPGEQDESPLNRPPVWRCTFQQTQEVAEYDFSGDAIVNAAGLPFDPPVMKDVSHPVVTLTRNVPTFTLANARLLQDAVNDAAWCGFPERAVKVSGVEFGPKYENGTAFFEVTYQLAVKYPNWDKKVLNAGYTEKTGGAWVKIVDANGRAPTEPVPLAADGTKLTPAGTPNFLTFRIAPERDFGTLIL